MPNRYRIPSPRLVALLVGAGALLGSAGAAAAAWREPDVYRSTITLQVLPAPAGGDPLIDQARTYVALATTGPTLERALESSGVVSGFSGLVAATDGLTPFVTVDVRGTDPVAAARVADALAGVLPAVAVQLEQATDSTASPLRAISPATVPTGTESIGLDRAAARGLFAGTLVGVAAAVVAVGGSRGRLEERQLEDATGLTVLASVPQDDERPLPTRTDPRGARAEAYQLVGSLLQADVRPARSVLVTSSARGEGRTALVANLGVSLAGSGERVLVVDADVRGGRLHRWFGADPGPGLLDVLEGRVPLERALQRVPGESVTVLTVGTSVEDATDLLAADGTAVLLQQLTASFDRIIVDSPPVSTSSVAAGLARRVDGVLMVSRRRAAGVAEVATAQQRLATAGATTLGLVLTGTSRHDQAFRAAEDPVQVPAPTTSDGAPSAISWQGRGGEGG